MLSQDSLKELTTPGLQNILRQNVYSGIAKISLSKISLHFISEQLKTTGLREHLLTLFEVSSVMQLTAKRRQVSTSAYSHLTPDLFYLGHRQLIFKFNIKLILKFYLPGGHAINVQAILPLCEHTLKNM